MPSIITSEIAEQICNELMLGEKSLRQCCEAFGTTHSDFLWTLRTDESLQNRYARAREIGDDAAFDRLREQQRELATAVDGRVDNGWVQWKRLQTDTLKWELSKRHPSKYGDKVQQVLTGADGGPIQSAISVEFVRPGEQEKAPADSEG